MKKWNNYLLLIVAFLLLLICAISVYGPTRNQNGTSSEPADTAVYNTRH